MSDQNAIKIIENLYAAFATGNIDAVTEAMADDIVWMESENFPYADRNPYVGPAAILEGVFGRIMAEWSRWEVQVNEIFGAGERVTVLGRYLCTHGASGQELDLQMAHIWTVKNGKITRFQQYADTLSIKRVIEG